MILQEVMTPRPRRCAVARVPCLRGRSNHPVL